MLAMSVSRKPARRASPSKTPKKPPGSTGQGFYNYNIRLLELLGRTTGLGYVLVSLLMGVLIPAVAAGLLLLVPRRRALLLWALLLALLLAYFWLGTRLA